MSSFIGHTIVGYAVSKSEKGLNSSIWTFFIILGALVPDLDYFLGWVLGIRFPIRYTHSIGYCLFFSLLIISLLKLFNVRQFKVRSIQMSIAVFSHLFMDLLVGVYNCPWLWPFSSATFHLPFGILPSAGKLSLFNQVLYRNLLIEIGILLPFLMGIRILSAEKVKNKPIRLIFCIVLWIPFIIWGISLKR
jgi:membrane-bound metal-dependent hydrolase YbcI (DUF457 family)